MTNFSKPLCIALAISLLGACAVSSDSGQETSELAQERAFASQPNEFFEARLEDPAVIVDGQKLHPKLQYEFQERRKARANSDRDYQQWLNETWSTPEGRKWLRDEVTKNWTKFTHQVEEPVETKDLAIPGPLGDIRARLYRPANAPEGPLPALMYMHGGGFLMANIEAVEPQSKIIATEGDIVVVSIDYALSPEHKFPAAHNDAIAAFDWIVENADDLGIDPERIGVGGDSAGGNLSIAISDERARTGKSMPKAQLLYYPFTDSDHARYPSYDLFKNGFGLDEQFIKDATEATIENPNDLEHKWLTSLRKIDVARQPKAVIATAGFDPIRDQGSLFAERLEQSGVEVIYLHYPSLNHGFLEASGAIDDAYEACFKTAQLIGEMLREE